MPLRELAREGVARLDNRLSPQRYDAGEAGPAPTPLTRGRMNLRAPSIHFILAAALLFLAVAVRIADPEPVARLRLSVFDSYLELAPRPLPADLPVRIVDIDEASLEARGPVAVAAHAACPHHRPPEGGRRAHHHARPDPRRARPALARGIRQALRRRARAGADDRRGVGAALQRRALGGGDRRGAPVILGFAGAGGHGQAAAAARALCLRRR